MLRALNNIYNEIQKYLSDTKQGSENINEERCKNINLIYHLVEVAQKS